MATVLSGLFFTEDVPYRGAKVTGHRETEKLGLMAIVQAPNTSPIQDEHGSAAHLIGTIYVIRVIAEQVALIGPEIQLCSRSVEKAGIHAPAATVVFWSMWTL
jgi:hypothetical protein